MVVSCRNYDEITEAFCDKMPLLYLHEFVIRLATLKYGLIEVRGGNQILPTRLGVNCNEKIRKN